MKTPGQSFQPVIIIFSGIIMDHFPTTFFILENEQLGTFWVGQAKMRLDECGFSLLPALTKDELIDKLESKYVEYSNPCLDLVSINKNGAMPFYGIERWLSKLDYKIKQSPKQFEELEKLLTAGWYEYDLTPNSTINVLHARNKVDMNALYKRLIVDWETKGMRCLNTRQAKTRAERYEESKKDPGFLKAISRKKVLHQMKKTQKMPKPSTIEKYQIKDEEIKECMGPRGVIYKITSPSGKVYVGQTIHTLEERIKGHKKVSSNCTLLKRAISKYGDEMVYEIIEEVPHELLDEREIYWIKYYNSLAPNGYNCSSGGNSKKELSDLLKDNISKGLKNNKINRDGYLGYVVKRSNGFVPATVKCGKTMYLSNGAFKTKEEAIEVLKEYTRDPENFTKPDGSNKRNEGCIYRRSDKSWFAMYKHKRIGTFVSEQDARIALENHILHMGHISKK
jgi:hypothetical protein